MLSQSLYGPQCEEIVGKIENSSCTWSCVKNISKCHNFCNFWQITKKKATACMIMIPCKKFGWNLMKTVEGVVFRKSWNRKLCKVHRMTPNQTQGIGHQKYPTYVHCSTPSPKFSSVSLYDQPFSRYCTSYDSIDSHVTSTTKCLIFRRTLRYL